MNDGKFACVKCLIHRGKDTILVRKGKAWLQPMPGPCSRGLKGRMFVFV